MTTHYRQHALLYDDPLCGVSGSCRLTINFQDVTCRRCLRSLSRARWSPLTLAYKLMRQRADGSLGPLFINRRQRIPIGKWVDSEDHPTRGYAHRPGWHTLAEQRAPHLSERGRVWVRVVALDYETHRRPEAQGGVWYLARRMKVLEVLS